MNSQPRTKEVAPADGTCKNPVPRDPVAIEQSHCHSYPPARASDGANVGTLEMDVWGALQYVGTGLGLVAFAVAAIFYAYRARLTNRAEIIKSAPEKQPLEAIARHSDGLQASLVSASRSSRLERKK